MKDDHLGPIQSDYCFIRINNLSIGFYYGGPSTDETECVPPPGPHTDRRLGQEHEKLSVNVVRTVK